jgi:hypothetical protein
MLFDLGGLEALGLEVRPHELGVLQREVRQLPRLAGELLRVLQGALEDEPGHRVDIDRRHIAAQAHRFQGDRAATGERVQHLGGTAAIGLADLLPEPVQIRSRLAPPVQDPAFGLPGVDLLHPPVEHLLFLGGLLQRPTQAPQDGVTLLLVAGIRQQRGDERCARCRQRPAGGPDV